MIKARKESSGKCEKCAWEREKPDTSPFSNILITDMPDHIYAVISTGVRPGQKQTGSWSTHPLKMHGNGKPYPGKQIKRTEYIRSDVALHKASIRIPVGLEKAIRDHFISTAAEGKFDYEHDRIINEAARELIRIKGAKHE